MPRRDAIARAARATACPRRNFLAMVCTATLIGTGLIPERASAAPITTYYVDAANPAASDAGPGTVSTPYKTIQAAVTLRGGVGRTIIVKPSVYREEVSVLSSGAPSKRFVIQASGPGVIVDGSDDFSSAALWAAFSGGVYRASSVTWAPSQVFVDGARLVVSTEVPAALPANSFTYVAGSGLYVNAGGGNPGLHTVAVSHRTSGFALKTASYVTIDGFNVTRTDNRGIDVADTSLSATISHNLVTFAGKHGIAIDNSNGASVLSNVTSDNNDHGIFLTNGSANCRVQGNESLRNARPSARAANGIDVNGAPNATVENNNTHDNQDSGIQFYNGADNGLSRNNRSWNNGDHGYDHLASSGVVHSHDVAYHNFKDGFSFEGNAPNGALYNCIGAENGLTTREFDLWVDSTSAVGFRSDYNVLWNSTSEEPVKFIRTLYTTVAAYSAVSGQDSHSLQVDPLFILPGAANFHLRSGSPAIDAANASTPSWTSLDADGKARFDDPATPNTGAGLPNYADIGAFEYRPAGLKPRASFRLLPSSGIEPLAVVADAAGSSDPDGSVAAYTFDFGDGTVVGPQTANAAAHTYAQGVWTATVSVIDNLGQVTTATARDTVLRFDHAPVVTAAATVSAGAGAPVTVNVVAADADGEAITALTANLSGLPAGNDAVFTPNPSHTAGTLTWTPALADERANPYTVVFQASNALTGSSSTAITVTRPNAPPHAALVLTPQGGPAPLAVTADASSSTDPDGPVVSYTFDFGDGTVIGPQASPTASHTYAAGTWSTTVQVADDLGATSVSPPVSAGVTGVGPNLVNNPSFESGVAGWVSYGNASLRQVAGGMDGSFALEMAGEPSTILFGANDSPNVMNSTTAGQRYRFSAWVRSDAHHGKAKVRVREFNGGVQQGATFLTSGLPLTPAWQRVSGDYVALTSGATLDFQVVDDPIEISEVFQADQVAVQTAIVSPPVVTVASFTSGPENSALAITVSASDPDGDAIGSLTADTSALPAGNDASFVVSPDKTSGTLTWMPTYADARPTPYHVSFTATNSASGSATAAIGVTNVDRAPTVSVPVTAAAFVGDPLTVEVVAVDPDGEAIASLTADLSGLPASSNAVFTPNGTHTGGSLTWTPALADKRPAPYNVTFHADNALSGAAGTAITVARHNTLPTAALSISPQSGVAPLAVTADASLSNDPDGTLVSYTFDFGDGTVVGPQASASATHTYAIGSYSATVHVTDDDGGASTSAPASVTGTGSGSNLAANPSFETSITGWGAFGSDTLRRVAGGNDGGFALEMAAGPSTLQFGANDSPNIVGSTTAGQRYRFSAWVRSDAHHGSARVRVREFNGGIQQGSAFQSPGVPLSPDWQLVTGDYVALTSGATLDFQVAENPLVPGELFQTDQVSVQLVTTSPPVVTVSSLVSGPETSPITITVTASDPEGEPIGSLTADTSALPAGNDASFSTSPDHTSGTLTWTPTYADARPAAYNVPFTATNSKSGTATTAIVVTNVDRAPTASAPANAGASEGTAVTVDVTASDPDGEPITSLVADLSALPPGNDAVFTPNASMTGGQLHWTPTYDDAGGPYTVTFRAGNALTATTSTAITVSNVDRAPSVIAPASLAVNENALLTLDVTAVDHDGQAVEALAADLSGLPAGSDAVFTSTGPSSGTLTWTPTFGDSGSYPVVFTATNVLVGSLTTAIHVVNVDRAPTVSAPATTSGTENQVLTVEVTAADVDGDAITTLTADLSGLPAGNNAAFTPNAGNTAGTLTWTPGFADAPGPHSVTFSALSGSGLTASATTRIDLTNVDRAPVVTAPAALLAARNQLLSVAVTAADPDGDAIGSLVADLSGLPAGNDAAFTPDGTHTGGTLTWTPSDAMAPGPYTVAFTAANDLSGSAPMSITLNQAPHAALSVTPASGNTPLLVTADASASFDPDGVALSYRFDFGDGATAGPQASPVATHTYGAGNFTIVATVTDSLGVSATASGAVAATTNLCGNPGLEAGTTGWQSINSTLSRVSPGHAGSFCLSVRGPNRLQSFGVTDNPNWIANVPAKNTRYRFSAWVRSAAQQGSVRLRIRELLGGTQQGALVFSSPVTLSTTWQLVSVDYLSLASNSTLDLEVDDAPASSGETFQMDDVSIALVDHAPVVTAPATVTQAEGVQVTVNVTAADADGDPIASLVANLSGLPAGSNAVFTANPSQTAGTLTWTPTASDGRAAAYNVIFTATNAVGVSASTAITVNDVPTPGTNQCANPGFETGTTGWAATGGSALSRVFPGHSGSSCLNVKGPSKTKPYGVTDNPNWVARVPGAGFHYRFSAWVRSAVSRGSVRLSIRELLGNTQQGPIVLSSPLVLSAAWQQISVDYVSLAANTTLDFEIDDTPLTSGESFQMDDVFITIVPAAATAEAAESRPADLVAPVEQWVFSAVVAPNPLSVDGVLRFVNTRAERVSVQVLDVTGRLVRDLVHDELFAPGPHRVPLRLSGGEGGRVAPGVYFYRVRADEGVRTGRFVIMK